MRNNGSVVLHQALRDLTTGGTDRLSNKNSSFVEMVSADAFWGPVGSVGSYDSKTEAARPLKNQLSVVTLDSTFIHLE